MRSSTAAICGCCESTLRMNRWIGFISTGLNSTRVANIMRGYRGENEIMANAVWKREKAFKGRARHNL